MAEEVFISYGSPDRDRIQDLVSRLRQAGVTVWIDEAGIEGAAMWSEEIVGAINHCKVLILAISPNSTKSKNVVRELALASEEEKTILPVFIAPTDIPESMKYQLAGIQRVDYFAGNEEEAIGSVLRALSRLGISAEESDTNQALGQAPPAPSQAKAKPPTLAIAAVAVIALLAAVFLFKPSNEPPTNKPSAPTTTEPSTTTQTPAKPLDKNRIVVLPFKNIGTAGENDYIVVGIVNDLNTMLTNVDGLTVIGSISAKTFKDTEKSPTEIGQELNTGTLIQGSIQKAGPQLKINVQVIDTISGEINWAKNFEGTDTDLFTLQSQIVKSVGENLDGIVIDEAKLNELKKSGTSNPKAYELVQRARVLLDGSSKVSAKKAIDLLGQAIQIDPNYADAHAVLGIAHSDSTGLSIAYPKEAFHNAKLAYEKCLEIDPNHPHALAGLGELAMLFDWNINKARQLLDQAAQRNPNDPNVIISHCIYYMVVGDSKRMAAMALAGIENDPKSALLHQLYFKASYDQGDMTNAEKHNLVALSLKPTFQWAIHERSVILLDSNKYEEAEKLLLRGIEDDPDNPVTVMSLGVVYYKWGKKEKAYERLSDLLHRSHYEYIKADIIARFYSAIGKHDKAIDWIGKMKERKEMAFMAMHRHPWFSEVYELEECKALYKEAGLYETLFQYRIPK
ncbi:MAG: TIR domain-containing protein [Verrucomicrobia bacterium]|nr:TIR domain-containing protein [Verrucomicrobiota bacterium]